MKNFKIFELRLEYFFRFLGYFIGVTFTVLALSVSFFTWLGLTLVDESILQQSFNSFSKGDLMETLIIFMNILFPIIGSIFILVATRKFKEINQLIKDKKEEIDLS